MVEDGVTLNHVANHDLWLTDFIIKVLHHNPPFPGLPDHAKPVLIHDRNDHNRKTNGALVHGNSSVIRVLLLHYKLTSLLNWKLFQMSLAGLCPRTE